MFEFLRYRDEGGVYRVERFDGEPLKVYLTPEEIAIEEAEMYIQDAGRSEKERSSHDGQGEAEGQ